MWKFHHGLICTAAGLRFLSPALKLHHQKTHFQWTTAKKWHLLLLFYQRPLIVGFNCLVMLVSHYGLDVPCLATMVGEHCNECGSEALVCEMRFYACFLRHLFHHVVQHNYAKKCTAKPDFVFSGIELLTLTICWSLKQSMMLDWDGSGSSWAFLLDIFQILGWKKSFSSNSSQASMRPPWWFFVAGKEPGIVLFNSYYSNPCGVFRRESIAADFDIPVLQKRSHGRTNPFSLTGQDSSCQPFRVHGFQIISSAALSRFLSCRQRQLFFCLP